MPAPSRLQIATLSLERLLKEESSYHKELEQGKARVHRLEGEKSTDDNAEYMIRQEKKAVQETEAVFPSLHQRIKEASSQLEHQMTEDGQTTPQDEAKANDALSQARALLKKH